MVLVTISLSASLSIFSFPTQCWPAISSNTGRAFDVKISQFFGGQRSPFKNHLRVPSLISGSWVFDLCRVIQIHLYCNRTTILSILCCMLSFLHSICWFYNIALESNVTYVVNACAYMCTGRLSLVPLVVPIQCEYVVTQDGILSIVPYDFFPCLCCTRPVWWCAEMTADILREWSLIWTYS